MVIDWDKTEKTPNLTAPAAEVTPGPPPETATQHDLPLGRRVAAAFVDLGLLSGLYIILALIVGPTSPGIGPVNVTLVNFTATSPSGNVFRFGLFGAWAVLYLILAACYYFGLEALAGQTVGKALLGLRVLQPDAARPAARQIAMRTLLRLFDVLPALYLVGFIAVLSSGRQRRQRLGDMAAGTVVDRTARSSRSLVLAWTCVVAVVLATAGLSAARLASPAGSQTYRGHGISFSYPAGWQQDHGTSKHESGNKLWEVDVFPQHGSSGVGVYSYRLTRAIGPRDLGKVTAGLRHLIRGELERQGGVLLSGPQRTTFSRMPGVRFVIGTYLSGGTYIKLFSTFAFSGTTEYEITCQATRPAAATIVAGCKQVLRTFRVTAPPAAQPSSSPSATLPAPPLTAAQWRHGLRLLLSQMNRTLGVSGVVTRAKLKAEASQLRRCTPTLASLGKPPPSMRSAYRTAARACAQFARSATYYAAAARAFSPYNATGRFAKLLDRGDAAANAGSSLLADAVGASLTGG